MLEIKRGQISDTAGIKKKQNIKKHLILIYLKMNRIDAFLEKIICPK